MQKPINIDTVVNIGLYSGLGFKAVNAIVEIYWWLSKLTAVVPEGTMLGKYDSDSLF